MKKRFTVILLFVFLINIIAGGATAYAKIFSNNLFSIEVPDGFTVDSETIDNYTSFIKDNVNIGISIHNNSSRESVTEYDDDKINEIASETVDILNAQAGEGINVVSSGITTISRNEYSALRIIYDGGTTDDPEVYIDEYIITTANYKYTLVFSADTANDLNNNTIKNMIESFTVYDIPFTCSGKKDDMTNTLILALALGSIVFIAGVTVIIYVINTGRKSNK